ncbi:hypothetical protein N7467_000967 [Penicillium canescens]|nr:hypothetical protein N7467_000967 [Penicillium canescens]
MDLEFWQPGAHKLVMRNYESPLVVSGPGAPVDVPLDADIITAPNTGVVLSTIEGLQERYLPGHEPEEVDLIGTNELVSPLRERIYRLISRYEHLYVLILKPDAEPPSTKQQSRPAAL